MDIRQPICLSVGPLGIVLNWELCGALTVMRNEKTAEKPTPETSSNLNVNNSNRTLPQQDGSGDSTGMPGKDTNCRSQ